MRPGGSRLERSSVQSARRAPPLTPRHRHRRHSRVGGITAGGLARAGSGGDAHPAPRAAAEALRRGVPPPPPREAPPLPRTRRLAREGLDPLLALGLFELNTGEPADAGVLSRCPGVGGVPAARALALRPIQRASCRAARRAHLALSLLNWNLELNCQGASLGPERQALPRLPRLCWGARWSWGSDALVRARAGDLR